MNCSGCTFIFLLIHPSVRPRIDYVRVPTTDIEAIADSNHGNKKDSHTANGGAHHDTEVEVITNGHVRKNSVKTRG